MESKPYFASRRSVLLALGATACAPKGLADAAIAPGSSRLALFVDRPANAYIDGQLVGAIGSDAPSFHDVYPGQHVVRLVPKDPFFDEWSGIARAEAGAQEVVTVKFRRGDPRRGVLGQFEDPRDGQVYRTVKFQNGLEWFAENVRFAVPDTFAPNGRQENIATYGRLYGFNNRALAVPPGWRVPSTSEWNALFGLHGAASAASLLPGEISGFSATFAGNYFSHRAGSQPPESYNYFAQRAYFHCAEVTRTHSPVAVIVRGPPVATGITRISNGANGSFARAALRVVR